MPSEDATTRFTVLVYLDADGCQCTREAHGWVGMVEESARVDFSEILGQMYFERPGTNAPLDMPGFNRQLNALGVSEITVVDLWSRSGAQRMCQEFCGRIDDTERLSRLLRRRLGRAMPEWQPRNYYVLKIPSPDSGNRWYRLGASVRRIIDLWRRGFRAGRAGRPT